MQTTLERIEAESFVESLKDFHEPEFYESINPDKRSSEAVSPGSHSKTIRAKSKQLSDQELLNLYQQIRSGFAVAEARKALVNAHIYLLYQIASKRANKGVDIDELIQEGFFGLMKAGRNFNPEYSQKDGLNADCFARYAYVCISEAMKETFKFQRFSLSLPANAMTLNNRINKESQKHLQLTGQTASDRKLAEITGQTPEKIRALKQAAALALSIDAPVNEDMNCKLGDIIADNNSVNGHSECELKEMGSQLDSLLKKLLKEREQVIIKLSFFHEKSDVEIAARFGISSSRVARIKQAALRKLRCSRAVAELESYL